MCSQVRRGTRFRSKTHVMRIRPAVPRRRRPSRHRRRATSRPRGTTTHGLVAACTLALLALVGLGSAQAGVRMPELPSGLTVPTPDSVLMHDALVEGRDYSFLAHVNGSPVRWPCGVPVSVNIEGQAPAGSESALAQSVAMLRDASGLDLRAGDLANGAGAITVRYAPAGTAVGDLHLDADPELGVGGPSWSARDGVIRSGEVLIRSDSSITDPLSATGRRVLLHELGHALGLGHAAAGLPEVMGSTTGADDSDKLGAGDLSALARVGCHR